LICADCGSPLSAELDCFAALELPHKLALELPSLERIYHELSRKVHPDRFASSAAGVRDASLRATALLTRSYRTLRDPIARGLYWLEIHGEKLAENNKQVPPDLADLVFDVQENLAELRDASGDTDSFDRLASQVSEKRTEVQTLMDESMAELERNFARWDEGKPAQESMLKLELKQILSKIAYLRTLLRDVDRALEGSQAA